MRKKGFIFFIIVQLALFIFGPFLMLYTCISYWIQGKDLNAWYSELYDSKAHYANMISAELFNQIFITSDSEHRFGKKEKISSVLGKNELFGTLTDIGLFACCLLETLDEHHCFNSINK